MNADESNSQVNKLNNASMKVVRLCQTHMFVAFCSFGFPYLRQRDSAVQEPTPPNPITATVADDKRSSTTSVVIVGSLLAYSLISVYENIVMC